MICEWNEERAKEDEVLSHSEDIVQVVWLKFRRQQKHAGPAMSKLQSSKEIDHFHKSTSSKFKELIWVVECKKSSSQYW